MDNTSQVSSPSNPAVDKITKELMARHEGEEIRYTVCLQNGCWEGCILACHVKDGKLTAIDVGDPINANSPREDVGMSAIKEGMIQHRPCVRGRMWRKTLDHPHRALYPMKNVGKRGDPVWERISWDEALDTVAGKIKETVEKYGPFSIQQMIFPSDVGLYAGYGNFSWGMFSFAGHELADQQVLGYDDIPFTGKPIDLSGTEPPDLFNTKLFIGFGWNPAITRPEYAYVLVKAKEQGIPIIIVDARFTPTVQTYADQWIPIRPGTDLSFIMAMANVLFKEDLIDKAFVDRFVEPEGLAKWRDHILGKDDGVDKTPEWAESICAVPAETIRELARLYGKHHGYSDGNACYMKVNWVVARITQGENVARAGIYLQALTGNIGVPGGHFNGGDGGVPPCFPPPHVDMQRAVPTHFPMYLMQCRGWVDAVLLRDKLDSGEISEEEYRRRIGSAKEWPLPNIHMIFNQVGSDLGTDNNQRVWEAYKKVDFVVSPVYHMDRPQAMYSDIVLPQADPFFEDMNDALSSGGFIFPSFLGTGTYGNYFILGQKVIEPPGEAKPISWISTQLAKRLGVLDSYNPRFKDVLDDPKAWDARFLEIQREAYEHWREQYAGMAAAMQMEPREAPPFEEFYKCPIFRIPLKREPYFAFQKQIRGGEPFDTPSGRIEFYSQFLADPDMVDKEFVLASGTSATVCYGGAKPPHIPAMAKYMEPWDGPLSELAPDYSTFILPPAHIPR